MTSANPGRHVEFQCAGEFRDLTITDSFLLDFYEHVGDAEGQSSCHVDQEKRVHPRQQHTAETWDDATQTVHKHNRNRISAHH